MPHIIFYFIFIIFFTLCSAAKSYAILPAPSEQAQVLTRYVWQSHRHALGFYNFALQLEHRQQGLNFGDPIIINFNDYFLEHRALIDGRWLLHITGGYRHTDTGKISSSHRMDIAAEAWDVADFKLKGSGYNKAAYQVLQDEPYIEKNIFKGVWHVETANLAHNFMGGVDFDLVSFESFRPVVGLGDYRYQLNAIVHLEEGVYRCVLQFNARALRHRPQEEFLPIRCFAIDDGM